MKSVSIKISNQNPPRRYDTAIDLKKGQLVIMDGADGAEWGKVATEPFECKKAGDNNQVLRIATDEDKKAIIQLVKNAEYAERIARQRVEKFKLSMKVQGVRYTLDGKKLLVQFTSEARVDFRELVRDLAASLRVRIELRQINPREHAKAVGGIGTCGLVCCCNAFGGCGEVQSLKSLREQKVNVSPQKANGMCGRLLCCLSYELQRERRESEPPT